MIATCLRATLAAFAIVVAPPAGVLAQAIIDIPTGDPVMVAAIDKARTTLPTFWETLANPGPADEGFAVKIYYPTGSKDGEHVWAKDVIRDGEFVSATIDNSPRSIRDLKAGQRVTVSIERLTDWMFFRDGKMHGAQTVRAVLPKLPKAQADALRAQLAPE